MAHLDRQSKQCALAKPTLHRQFQLSLKHDFKIIGDYFPPSVPGKPRELRKSGDPIYKESSFQQTTLGSRGAHQTLPDLATTLSLEACTTAIWPITKWH